MKLQIVLRALSIAALVGLGVGTAVVLDLRHWLGVEPQGDTEHADHSPHAAAPDEGGEEDEEDHIHLTAKAMLNLGVRIGKPDSRVYFRSVTIPGEVVEIPGHSGQSISAPVGGIVQKITVRQGESLRVNQPLFELQVTDQDLIDAQLGLLDVINQLAVISDEIQRISPFTESGAVAGRRKVELEYELRKLQGQRETRLQELTLRGLSDSQVLSIVQQRKLLRSVTLTLPDFLQTNAPNPDTSGTLEAAEREPRDGFSYIVETLNVQHGDAVTRGQELCHLAYHPTLMVRGEAFETELSVITSLQQERRPIEIEFGHRSDGHQPHTAENTASLPILYVDNHVDPETQTFLFYVRLENRIEQDMHDEDNRLYRQWRFKPGQRVHTRIPVERFESSLVVPIDAIVKEGADFYTFVHRGTVVSHPHPEDEHSENEDHEHEVEVEFERVPVHVLHQDEEFAVIEPTGQFDSATEIALNQAYMLQLTMKMGKGTGHDHHHHDH